MSETSTPGSRTLGLLVSLFVALCVAAVLWPLGGPDRTSGAALAQSTEPVEIVMELPAGPVRIALRPDLAPLHVERLTTLIEEGFYDGLVFHRVIEGFMAQTGDPTGTGAGGSDLPDLPAEFSDAPFERGTLGMARSASPDSANSQFFITFEPAPHLNGQYTVIGEVISGMEHVDALKMGDTRQNGAVEDPDAIVSMRLAGDQ